MPARLASRTGFVAHPDGNLHDPGPDHPERPERVQRILASLAGSGLLRELDLLEPEMASRADLELVHGARYVERVREAARRAPTLLDGSVAMVGGSLRAARLAVGGALAAVARVLSGDRKNAFVSCRPPGHLAAPDAARGFCIFNQAAIAAAALRRRHGVDRVAILDFDVEHGTGTQLAFAADPTVFYASVHQAARRPERGAASDRGIGAGDGTTLHCPLPPGSGERDWLAALDRRVLPALERFEPGFLLLSAGFGAHRAERLARQDLDSESYRRITARCLDFARDVCEGRIVSLLEGGFEPVAIAAGVQAHVEGLHAAPSRRPSGATRSGAAGS